MPRTIPSPPPPSPNKKKLRAHPNSAHQTKTPRSSPSRSCRCGSPSSSAAPPHSASRRSPPSPAHGTRPLPVRAPQAAGPKRSIPVVIVQCYLQGGAYSGSIGKLKTVQLGCFELPCSIGGITSRHSLFHAKEEPTC